jgi:hypothetical protein
MDIDFGDALFISSANASKRYPAKDDARCAGGMTMPDLAPRFRLRMPSRVFTIGSCFARNIEEALDPYDVTMPTRHFTVPSDEWKFRPNGLLNEYNPGSIAQRIGFALDGTTASPKTVRAVPGGAVDLLLPGGPKVDAARAIERRAQIDAVYRELPRSDLLIITLGMTEAWYDTEAKAYLNRMPPGDARRETGRYVLRVMDLDESVRVLDAAFTRLFTASPDLRVVMTVSPVPMQTTFTSVDAVLANTISKSTLRLCAQALWERFERIDYFPSYEMILSAGPAAFGDDNVHVRGDHVERVTGRMIKCFFGEG